MAAGPAAAVDFQEGDLQVAGESHRPSWLKSFLSEEDLIKIKSSVADAEKRTQAEIVPMIVRSSVTKGFLPFHIFLILNLFILIFFRDGSDVLFYSLIVASFPISIFLAGWPFLQRALIPKSDQESDVFHRAHFEFHQKKVGETFGSTGVLIFVSLNEHRAVILSDKGVAAEIDNERWAEAVQLLIAGIKNKKTGEGFCNAITHCANLLEKLSPAEKSNPNEISNRLLIEE